MQSARGKQPHARPRSPSLALDRRPSLALNSRDAQVFPSSATSDGCRSRPFAGEPIPRPNPLRLHAPQVTRRYERRHLPWPAAISHHHHHRPSQRPERAPGPRYKPPRRIARPPLAFCLCKDLPHTNHGARPHLRTTRSMGGLGAQAASPLVEAAEPRCPNGSANSGAPETDRSARPYALEHERGGAGWDDTSVRALGRLASTIRRAIPHRLWSGCSSPHEVNPTVYLVNTNSVFARKYPGTTACRLAWRVRSRSSARSSCRM